MPRTEAEIIVRERIAERGGILCMVEEIHMANTGASDFSGANEYVGILKSLLPFWSELSNTPAYDSLVKTMIHYVIHEHEVQGRK